MADLNDLSKPDLVSNYSTEVLQTIRGHIARLWAGDYAGMGGLVANMRRWIDLGGGNAKLVKRNADGSETTIFDSSTKVSQSYVDNAVTSEATARASAVSNEAANRVSDIANEVANRNSAISAEATARANADALKADKTGGNASGMWPINISGNAANGGVTSVNGQVGAVNLSLTASWSGITGKPTALSQFTNDIGALVALDSDAGWGTNDGGNKNCSYGLSRSGNTIGLRTTNCNCNCNCCGGGGG